MVTAVTFLAGPGNAHLAEQNIFRMVLFSLFSREGAYVDGTDGDRRFL
jgi:hypothetical protein